MKKLLILLAAVSMVATFTMSAMASTWDFYGSARFQTFYTATETGEDNDDIDTADAGTTWALLGTTRFGAKVKATDEVSGRIEMNIGSIGSGGVADGTANGADVGIRLAYGVWKITPTVSLLVGRDWAPITNLSSAQGFNDAGLGGSGGLDCNRENQIRIDVSFGEGMGLKIGLLTPSTNDPNAVATVSAEDEVEDPTLDEGDAYDTDVFLPKIELAFNLAIGDAIALNFFLGYNSFTVDKGTRSDEVDNYTVTSFILGVNFGLNLGAFSLKVDLWYGVNAANYDSNLVNSGRATGTGAGHDELDEEAAANLNEDGDGLDSASTIAILLVPRFKVSDTIAIEANLAYMTTEAGEREVEDNEGGMSIFSFVFLANITVAKGVTISPELGYSAVSNNSDASDDLDWGTNTEFYFGAKWQIDF